ncbi:hypothetical protein KBZ21_44335, partial [Streptomyces sp. A73]|nr:hypothetical protein [Streptomyces sp. A73]
VAYLEDQLRRRGAAHPNPTVRADTAAARAQLSELRAELDRARAQLAYDQAVQRLKDQTTETKRLKTETAAANKIGVS